ncbi:MAG: 4Fe-4S binding protein [Candidatus Bipolaricaulota bacterium]|nr:4Fe-4S binding protein [Candidatus Bipolaricaulota bacterium]
MSDPASERTPTEYIGHTVPMHVEITATEVVLTQPEMRELLAAAELIAVGECMCRRDKGVEACGRPLDVCLGINAEARQSIEKDGWRAISLDEALDVLETSHRAGLVHMAYHKPGEEISIVCSCCSCCCGPFQDWRGRDFRDGFVESNYVARFDADRCIGCGQCAERCHFGAFSLGANRAEFEEPRCFGCGLCVSTCPAGAIELVKRAVDSKSRGRR